MTPLDSYPLAEPVIERAGADVLVPVSDYDRCVLALDACRRALAESRTTGEAREAVNLASALKEYARQAKDKGLEADAFQIRSRAERRLGELVRLQRETVGLASGGEHGGRSKIDGSRADPSIIRPTLAEAGIDKHLANQARKLARLSEAEFDRVIEIGRERIVAAGRDRARLDNLTGNIEWFTDPRWLKRVRDAMGGIDLDPASCEFAQRTVQAAEWFNEERDGLVQPWHGRVYLNPPFARGLVDKFIDKLVCERPNYDEAILLVNSQTETAWFQKLGEIANVIAFPRGRVYFHNERTRQQNPVFGSAFVYIGERRDAFVDAFADECLVLAGGVARASMRRLGMEQSAQARRLIEREGE